MFLQRAFPPDAKGRLKAIYDQEQGEEKLYDEETLRAVEWLNSKGVNGQRMFSQSLTIIAAWPTPMSMWVAPANISVFPCGDGSVAVTAYVINQTAYQLGKGKIVATVDPRGTRKKHDFDRHAESYIRVHVRVFPATAECYESRDDMRKYPPFYEVSITCMNVVRIRSWFTTTHSIIGDWMRDYWLGNKMWNGHSLKEFNPSSQQIIVWNDTGHTRRACGMSSNNHKGLKDRAWLVSNGTAIQGNTKTIVDVSSSHDQFASDGIEIPSYFVDVEFIR